MRQPKVFVGSDHVLGDCLNTSAERLAELGYEIIRGNAASPPKLTRYPPELLQNYFSCTDAILVSSRTVIDADMLSLATRLRGVIFASIGTDTVDLKAATNLGILVANGATRQNIDSLAEAGVMLIAALLLDLNGKQRQFAYQTLRPDTKSLSAHMVSGKTIGLLGFGRIAQAVASRLQGWQTDIIAHTRRPSGTVSRGVRMVGFEELLARSDVLSVHLPLTPETRGLLGNANLSLMKRGAYLVNTSRGGIIDEVALARRLRNGDLGGAAIDVFETEPPPLDNPLRKLPNVILTEHSVGCTSELFASLPETAVENVVRIISGREPLHIRNPEALSMWRQRLSSLALL